MDLHIYSATMYRIGKVTYESNILHITSYFYEEVLYYSYIHLTISRK